MPNFSSHFCSDAVPTYRVEPLDELASNCRTSVEMIERHYARWLAPRLLKVNG